MNKSPIEWTEVTWNPVRGCSRVSEGCRYCYAERDAARKNENPKLPGYRGFSRFVQIGGKPVPQWTGKVEPVPSKFTEPLHWSKPRLIFVNSMSDLFHEKVTDETLLALFTVMANSHIATGIKKTHTFQILTKREDHMLDFCRRLKWRIGMGFTPEIRPDGTMGTVIVNHMPFLDTLNPWSPLNGGSGKLGDEIRNSEDWMPPQIHLGVSVEDQPNADKRVATLLKTPAAVRFVSYEPALGSVDFRPWLPRRMALSEIPGYVLNDGGTEMLTSGLDWIIAGGESGPHARPPNPTWFQRVRDDCAAAGVPFLFKQWGDWSPDKPANWVKLSSRKYSHETAAWDRHGEKYNPVNPPPDHFPSVMMYRVGKKTAGRLLDGREWNGMP